NGSITGQSRCREQKTKTETYPRGSDTTASHQARPKGVGVGGAEVEWKARRSPAIKASFLVHASRHCTAGSGTMSTRHCTKKETKKQDGSTWSRGKGSTPIVHSEWLTDIRMVVVQMPRGGCDCSGLRGRREGTETQCGPHPSRLTVTPVTSSRQIACSKDRRRQRSVPSLSHWSATPPTQPLASSLTKTTREQR
ncbi:hypothetical protein TcCL_ESM08586, partial [Trypanosoma cruzi]